MTPVSSEALQSAIEATAKAFRLGQEGQGSIQLGDLTTALSDKMTELSEASLQQLTPQLDACLKAISRRDYLFAADLLEYEIMPLFAVAVDAQPDFSAVPQRQGEQRMTHQDGSLSPDSTIPTDEATFSLDWGVYGILQLLQDYQFTDTLDIGSGAGEHKRFLEFFGKNVFSVDILKTADFVGDFMEITFDRQFEAIWCSHVLEHQRNIGLFLDKIFETLKEDGILALTVPIHPRERLISGHLSSWSIPLLCYNLIMAGFDCKEARIIETFELTIIVQKRLARHSEVRNTSAHGADAGHEFDNLADFFPFEVSQGAEICGPGTIAWDNILEYSLPEPVCPGVSHINIRSKNFADEPELTPVISINR